MSSDAKQANVYLVLDMHAAPCSQMYAFVSDYVGPDFLWSSPACRDRMVALWKAIAGRYANQNIIAGYDLLGETIIGDAQLLGLYKRVTAAIRPVDPNHLIIYEGNDMARTFELFTAPLDSNQMLSFHDYSWAFPGQDLAARMAGYDAAASRLNTPQWAGEFGQSTHEDIQKYVTAFNSDPLMAGWTQWTWKQSRGFAALQTIEHTAASRKLVDWIANPSRPRPTDSEAAQGMSDFIRAIRFENTLHDAKLRRILDAAATTTPSSAVPAPSSAPLPSRPTASSSAAPPPATVAPSRHTHRRARCRGARIRGKSGGTRSSPAKRRSSHRRSRTLRGRCGGRRANESPRVRRSSTGGQLRPNSEPLER